MVARSMASESLLEAALRAAGEPRERIAEAIEALPAPVYLADAQGRITHYNQACVEFAGREPDPARDRWCVTWKLHTTDGEPLAHENCPMAIAIREAREVRGVEAVAERPDGTRVRFVPLPTPLFDGEGRLTGAVNLLLDVEERACALRAEAARCRRLANPALDRRTLDSLEEMAREYDREADRLSD